MRSLLWVILVLMGSGLLFSEPALAADAASSGREGVAWHPPSLPGSLSALDEPHLVARQRALKAQPHDWTAGRRNRIGVGGAMVVGGLLFAASVGILALLDFNDSFDDTLAAVLAGVGVGTAVAGLGLAVYPRREAVGESSARKATRAGVRLIVRF